MEFKFLNYIFSDDLKCFYIYLNENNLVYKTKRNKITFEIISGYCKVPIKVLATFNNDKIIRLELYCQPISFSNRKAIEEEMNSNYKLLERNQDTSISYYESGEYTIKMINPEHIWIDVQFQRIFESSSKNEKECYKKVIPFTIIGILLSVLFIILYFYFKDFYILNIFTVLIASAYAIFQFYYIYLRNTYKSKGVKIAICIVFPMIYILLISLISICFFTRTEIIMESINIKNIVDILLVFIYLSPSFHILLLVAAGLSYV